MACLTSTSFLGRSGVPMIRYVTCCQKPRSVVCFSASQPQPSPSQPQYYPGVDEEFEVSHRAFHKAFDDAIPSPAKVPGLQQFAASIWDRRRRIPSNHDPVLHIFDEFDQDNDGILSSEEIAQALRSRGIESITPEQVQWLINSFEESKACALPSFRQVVTRQQWPDFVYSLTVADMHADLDASKSSLDMD